MTIVAINEFDSAVAVPPYTIVTIVAGVMLIVEQSVAEGNAASAAGPGDRAAAFVSLVSLPVPRHPVDSQLLLNSSYLQHLARNHFELYELCQDQRDADPDDQV